MLEKLEASVFKIPPLCTWLCILIKRTYLIRFVFCFNAVKYFK